MVKVCAIKSCPSGRKSKKKINDIPHSLSFFQPTTPTRLENWTKSLGIRLEATDYICQLHFKEEHIKMYDKIKIGNNIHLSYLHRKVLKEGASPTIKHQFNPVPEQQRQACITVEHEKQNSYCSYYSKEQQHQHVQHNYNEQQELLEQKVCNIFMDYEERTQENVEEQVQIRQIRKGLDEHQQTQACMQLIDYFKNNVKNFSILPAYWFFIEKPTELEFMRVDPTSKQIKNHIRLNEDLSITVIYSNNEEFCLNEEITSLDNIYNYLKSVEKWPLCVGTQIERNKYSKKCKGVIVGAEAYKRNQMNPRCKSCRILRNQLQSCNSTSSHLEKSVVHKRRAESLVRQCKRLKKMTHLDTQSQSSLPLSSILSKPTVKCRICWEDKETELCVIATTKWSKESDKTIKDVILLCVPWMSVEEDCHLCKPCLLQLKFLYDFIGRCLKTENIINELNNKTDVKISLEDILERNLRSGNKIQIIFENPISPQPNSVIDLTEYIENANSPLQETGDSLGNMNFKSHTSDLPASSEHNYCVKEGAQMNVNITKKQENDTESVTATQNEPCVEMLEKKDSEEASTVKCHKENIFDINDDHLDNDDNDFFSDTPTKYSKLKCVSDPPNNGILHDILNNKKKKAVLKKYDNSRASYVPPPPKNELTQLLDIAPINIRFITAKSEVSSEQQSDLIRDGINIVNMSKDPNNKKRTIFLARDLFESYSRCSKCNLTFLSRSDVSDHHHLHRKGKIKTHGEPVHTCKFCFETFTHDIDFRTHTKIHHGICQPHVCTKCNRKFKILKMLKDHQKTFEAQEKCVYTCKKCNKEFMTKVALTNHEKAVADAPCCNYKKCNVCFQKFTKENFKIHCEQVHSNYLCPECGKSFVESVNLYIHKRNVHNPEKLMCHECGKILSHPRSLEHHIQSVHGNKIYMCDKCPRQFTCRTYLQKHSKVHLEATAVKRRKFQCDQCGKVYSKEETLRIHQKMVHLGIKRFICSICNEGFTRNDYLKRHIRFHEKYVQNVCQICKKSFGSSWKLHYHTLAGHDEDGKSLEYDAITKIPPSFRKRKNEYKKGAYPYKCVCKICNRVLANPGSLKKHYKAHLRLKDKYKCSTCGIFLQTRSALNRHLKLHDDPNFKFSCNICHAYKASSIELEQHILEVHKKLKYTCSICFESFGRKHLLSHHVALVHPEETQKKEVILKILEKDRIFAPKDSDTERGNKNKKVHEIDIDTFYNQLVKDNDDLNNVQGNVGQKSSALGPYRSFSEDQTPIYVSENKKVVVSEIDYQISEETKACRILDEEN